MSHKHFEVFVSCPQFAGIDDVIADNRQEALEIASANHPGCALAAFRKPLIPAAYRQDLLADWIRTL